MIVLLPVILEILENLGLILLVLSLPSLLLLLHPFVSFFPSHVLSACLLVLLLKVPLLDQKLLYLPFFLLKLRLQLFLLKEVVRKQGFHLLLLCLVDSSLIVNLACQVFLEVYHSLV